MRLTVRVGDLEIDTAARRVSWKGHDVQLSAREYALLEALADRPGAYLTRAGCQSLFRRRLLRALLLGNMRR